MNQSTNALSQNGETRSSVRSRVEPLADAVVEKADRAIATSKSVANDAIDAAHDTVERLGDGASDALHRATAQATRLARIGIEKARGASQDVRHRFERASDHTVGYIRHEPVKSIAIAAVVGAGLAALVALLARPSERRTRR